MLSWFSAPVFAYIILIQTFKMDTSSLPEEEEKTSAAVRALGPLFKLTEIFLWNDDLLEVEKGLSSQMGRPMQKDNAETSSEDFLPLPEDLELTRQMNELGLPVSFQTNKEKRTASEGKRKDRKEKNFNRHKKIDNDILSSVIESEGADASAAILIDSESNALCSVSMLGLSEQSYSDIEVKTDNIADEISNPVLHYSLGNYTGLSKNLAKEDVEMLVGWRLNDESSPGSCLLNGSMGDGGKELDQRQRDYACIESSVMADNEAERETLSNDVDVECVHQSQQALESQSTELVGSDTADSSSRGAFGDWREYWDNYYLRTYFFNIVTQESTWDPPPGMEELTFTNAANGLTELRVEAQESNASVPDSSEFDELGNSCVLDPCIGLTNELENDNGSFKLSLTESGESSLSSDRFFGITNAKRKNKTRRLKSYGRYFSPNEESQSEGAILETSPIIGKYWHQRYRLFSRFDEGIKMDEEGWFSVTPEGIARHHASRCAGGVIVDCFTGMGGNAIQFAKRCQHVVAIDIDPKKIEYARHNAAVYGVEDLIDFVRGDCMAVAPKFKADAVFLSPPWGGPDYTKVEVFDINAMLRPYNGHFLFQVAKMMAPKVLMFLPKNVNITQLVELALSASPPWSLEVEKNYVNGRLKAITAYFDKPTA